MEDGEYTLAADEKHRVEEKQRSKRRDRDTMGEVYAPQWFVRDQCPVTGVYSAAFFIRFDFRRPCFWRLEFLTDLDRLGGEADVEAI
ncbi:ATP12 ATPase F1F0-assembly protein [Penicillium vulpinum]|uniref:ATP12 ATPase F1F0-assembly protein n=1 Tax=Penicillium vulpinum TaxID=29845 RepID=UPI002549364A|nr:ATP12 ATPase F1F0-assembly protein [Penicillium vulpinum]KAJ5972505.1 ATP12 ATPase F1F0-assembly protein [Penicillium vulpinum]